MTQPTYPQPGYQQPPQPKKTPLAVKIVVIVAILIWVGGCGAIIAAIGSADTTSTTAQPTPAATTAPASPAPTKVTAQPESEPAEPAKPAEPGIGDKVRDDDYQFTVTKVRCGVSRVGGSYYSEKAQGEFCLVSMRVKNVDDDPINFSSENQALIDTKGKSYSPDDEAWIHLDSDPYAEINPGNTLKTIVPFDIPKKAKPHHLLLKAGFWGASDGVVVKL